MCKFCTFQETTGLIAIAGNTGGEIHVYDSMGSSDLPEETKQQIAALIFTSANKITLSFQSVQRQQDSMLAILLPLN